jgi:hypothetical protein
VYSSAVVVLLVLSILVILITFLGCCGAQQDSRCMLATVSCHRYYLGYFTECHFTECNFTECNFTNLQFPQLLKISLYSPLMHYIFL